MGQKKSLFSSSSNLQNRKNHHEFRRRLLFAFLISFFFLSTSCESKPKYDVSFGWTKNAKIAEVGYDIYVPQSYRGRNIMVLPGWNFPKEDWIQKTKLKTIADEKGYALILPDMKKTIYESEFFPETRMKWSPNPGLVFIKSYLIPEIQTKHHLLLVENQKNYLLGLSTGGRGVVQISLDNPGLFSAGLAFSGDFNQEEMPKDNLMTAVYGPITEFHDRWVGKDNPTTRIEEWKMPIYLSHGILDRVVPPSQTESFCEALKKANKPNVSCNMVKGMTHDYDFWGSELKGGFEFLENY